MPYRPGQLTDLIVINIRVDYRFAKGLPVSLDTREVEPVLVGDAHEYVDHGMKLHGTDRADKPFGQLRSFSFIRPQ